MELSAISGLGRYHKPLQESNSCESSPEAPAGFHTLGRDRPECQQGQVTRSLRLLSRTARCSIGGACQKLQRRCGPRQECLVSSPTAAGEQDENRENQGNKADTPKRGSHTRTPTSATRRTGLHLKAGSSRRQLVRMAALRSPFASPNALSRRQQFERDLESVSSGIRKLKRLSKVFDEVIGRDERNQPMENYQCVVVRSCSTAHTRQASLRCTTRKVRAAVGSWTDAALSAIHKAH